MSSDTHAKTNTGPAGETTGFGPLMLMVEDSASTLLIRMAGELDLANIGQVTAALDRIDVERTTLLVLDLRRLDFLDLAGLRTLLRANDHCKQHHIGVKIVKPRGFASRVFTLTGVHRQLALVDWQTLRDQVRSHDEHDRGR
jgi:anti-anti-sigma factor